MWNIQAALLKFLLFVQKHQIKVVDIPAAEEVDPIIFGTIYV